MPSTVERPHRTVLVVIMATLLVLGVASGVGTALVYRHLDGRITTGGVIEHHATKAPEPHGPLNILLIGTDTRDCPGCRIDRETESGGSDVTILLHVAADRRSAYGISIPRDALVDRPSCLTESGETAPAESEVMWNEAYAVGGGACTARQLEALSGVYVDHYVAINFAGFVKMVDAVGGVVVCIPEEVDDPEHNIHLDAGEQRLDGAQSLSYVRERSSTPNADHGRMRRQQAFLASLINEVFSAGTLTRPDRLYRFARALTGSITTDPDIGGLRELSDLAGQLRDADLGNIRFVTVPNEDFPRESPDYGRVRILPEARRLWQQVRADLPLGARFAEDAISAAQPPNSASTPPASSSTGPAAPGANPGGTGESDEERAAEAEAHGLCS